MNGIHRPIEAELGRIVVVEGLFMQTVSIIIQYPRTRSTQ
jgi:hypothetical protein